MQRDLPEIQFQDLKGKLSRPLKFIALAIAAFVFLLFMNPFVIVGAGERGVVLNFGAVQPHVLAEGIHFRVPVMQRIIKMDVTIHKSQTDAELGDGQNNLLFPMC